MGVSGVVTNLKVRQDLVTGERARSIDIQLEWKPVREPILVSAHPARASFLAAGLAGASVSSGGGLVPPETPLRHTWSVAIPAAWLPREPWCCSVEGTAIVAERFAEVPLGRVGALMDRLGQGPFEAAREGKFRCLVKRVERRGNRLAVGIRVEVDPHGVELESHQSWVVLNRLEARVGDKARTPFGYSIEGQDASFAEATYHFPAGLPADAMLSYRALAGLRKVPVRFDFKDIPPW